MRVLLLGGTTEASQIGRELAAAGIAGVYSYAGRTATPVVQPLPTRVGGFGGVDGLADYLRREQITHVIDATHPFAAQMSRNAIDACSKAKTALIAYERAPWMAQAGDNWRHVGDIEAAVVALPVDPARVFLAIGKRFLSPFAVKPQHFYLLRFVNASEAALPLRGAEVVLGRGPFTLEGDLALLKSRGITHVVSKNSGGDAAKAKLDAARTLGLPVIMIDRPHLPERRTAQSVDEILRWLGHAACLGV